MLVARFSLAQRRLPQMEAQDARHIIAARCWVMLRKAGIDPLDRLERHLQSRAAAVRFSLLMESIMPIWPEPFAVYRPCSALVSIDERLLADAIRLARAGARRDFDRHLCEMFSCDERQLIYSRATSAE
jgi:hypothetical protein